MSSDEDKDAINNAIYFDEAGYGSIKNTYSDARLNNSKITLKCVETWFSKIVGKKQTTRRKQFIYCATPLL